MAHRLPAAGILTEPSDSFRNYQVWPAPEKKCKRKEEPNPRCTLRPKFVCTTRCEERPFRPPPPLTQPGLLCFEESMKSHCHGERSGEHHDQVHYTQHGNHHRRRHHSEHHGRGCHAHRCHHPDLVCFPVPRIRIVKGRNTREKRRLYRSCVEIRDTTTSALHTKHDPPTSCESGLEQSCCEEMYRPQETSCPCKGKPLPLTRSCDPAHQGHKTRCPAYSPKRGERIMVELLDY